MKKTYAEKLLDPRWQRRRLEIMERDDFACLSCCSEENTLHVHHRYYMSGREPWEYPDAALITLCEPCHREFGETSKCWKNVGWECLVNSFGVRSSNVAWEILASIDAAKKATGESTLDVLAEVHKFLEGYAKGSEGSCK